MHGHAGDQRGGHLKKKKKNLLVSVWEKLLCNVRWFVPLLPSCTCFQPTDMSIFSDLLDYNHTGAVFAVLSYCQCKPNISCCRSLHIESFPLVNHKEAFTVKQVWGMQWFWCWLLFDKNVSALHLRQCFLSVDQIKLREIVKAEVAVVR